MHLAQGTASLDISVIGYEFPNNVGDHWDSNWLNVEFALRVGDESFRGVEPCLTTFELTGLASWLEEVADCVEAEGPLRSSHSFTEPTLKFEISSGPPMSLRVHISAKSMPLSASRLDFPVRRGLLIELSNTIRDVLVKFPYRPPDRSK